MENPWLKLPERAPYVLECDRECVERYNHKKSNPDEKVDTSLIPEPFIGNPWSAKLVLLSLNPGWDKGDAKAHADTEFKSAMFRNLHHERQAYPFYALNPEFESTPCGQWWLKRTKRLIEGCDRATVAERLLVIEWFPYHSRKSGLAPTLICESQRYSCHLAKQMHDKGAIIVLLRSREHWTTCDERFSKLLLPKSVQNPSITPGNFGEDLFKRMRQALCGGE